MGIRYPHVGKGDTSVDKLTPSFTIEGLSVGKEGPSMGTRVSSGYGKHLFK